MKKLEINSDAVISAFKNGTKDNKQLLKDLFKDQITFSDKITDKVTSFETACEILNINTDIPTIGLLDKYKKHFIAEYKLMIITEALNEGWCPDWNNHAQYKWYIYSLGGNADTGANAGLGDSNASYSVAHVSAVIGSRLCYKSRELVEYSQAQFKDLWLDYFNI